MEAEAKMKDMYYYLYHYYDYLLKLFPEWRNLAIKCYKGEGRKRSCMMSPSSKPILLSIHITQYQYLNPCNG